jgi:tetratricopeptide (TPR) repeat protein
MSVGLGKIWTLGLALFLGGTTGSVVCPQSSPSQQPTTSEEVPLQVIVVRTPEEAQSIVDQLKSGATFANLAREKSIDPTAEAGGYMGKLAPGSLRSELRNALQGIGPGQFTAPVHVPSGYAIVKVMEESGAPASRAADPARNFSLAATGTIKYATDVDGLGEVEAAIRHYPKPANWSADPHTVCDIRKKSIEDMITTTKAFLAPGNTELIAHHPAIDVMQAHFALGELYAYQGDMEPALEQYKAAYQLALSNVHEAIPQMEESLGIAYLHKSEMENEAYSAPGKKCLFPAGPEEAYRLTEDSNTAIELFLKFLDKKPADIEARWLLNLAYMTIGKYPAGVPEKYLISPSLFQSQENIGRFLDVAAPSGLKLFSMAGGVIVDDFENNGLLDVVTSSFGSCGTMHYFHNNGDGTFTENTTKSGLGDQVSGLNILQADYNNDGCMDILVLRGAWEWPQRKSLLKNNCDGTFTDVTKAAGLTELTSTQAAVWVDINNDGWVDLFVGNETGSAELFLNKGDGTFQDISLDSGVAGDGSAFSKGVAAADYDGDGYIDLYVSNLNGDNILFHNNHNNTFTDVTRKAGVPGGGRGFATWFFDYDNDGLPDLFTTSYFTSVEETVRTYLGAPHNTTTLKLYKNLGNGTFRDVTIETGLDKVYMPMGANFGDVDNDGYLDLYLGTGNPSFASLVPNVLLRNHGGKYFVDITTSSGTGELHKGHGIAFADLGNNGNEDLIAEIGGAVLSDSHTLRLFHNPGHDNDWITVKLVGVKSNRAAIGARIKVTVENEGQSVRSIWRTVGSGGSFGSSPLQQHIGLGKSAKITSLEVFWPASGTHQVFTSVDKDQFVEVKEFAENYTKLERKPFQLKSQTASASTAASNSAASKGERQ